MGIFRRKSDTTAEQATQQQLSWTQAGEQFRDNQQTFWQRERAKYQAKLDQLIADGKGDSGAAQRTRTVIARCDRKIADGG